MIEKICPLEVILGQQYGMPAKYIVNLDDIMTIQNNRLTQQFTALLKEKMTAVSRAIALALDQEI